MTRVLKIGLGAGAAIMVGVAVVAWAFADSGTRADPGDAEQVALGRTVYAEYCASCHGADLKGQPEWRSRQPNGCLPAPPHDESGHTWHHPDDALFGIVKQGLGPYAPASYESDMPAFGGALSDEQIWAVLAYIKSTWPSEIQQRHTALSEQSRK